MQFVIVLAAGSGVRFGGSALPKQLVEVGGKPLFIHSVDTYRGMAEIDRIYLVVNPKYAERFAKIIDQWGCGDRLVTVPGGATRQESIRNALDVIDLTDGLVVLQNAASPLTSVALIRECLAAARSDGAARTVRLITRRRQALRVLCIDGGGVAVGQVAATFHALLSAG